jgi:hypothetical protein
MCLEAIRTYYETFSPDVTIKEQSARWGMYYKNTHNIIMYTYMYMYNARLFMYYKNIYI